MSLAAMEESEGVAPRSPPPTCGCCSEALEGKPAHRLWDGKHYCMECLSAAGLEDVVPISGPLEEKIEVGFVRALGQGLLSGVAAAGLIALVMLPLFMAMAVGFAVQDHFDGLRKPLNPWNPPVLPAGLLARLWMLPLMAAVIYGGSCLLLALATIPVFLWTSVRTRQRTIRVCDGHLEYDSAWWSESAPLAECTWRSGTVAWDNAGLQVSRFGFVRIRLPDLPGRSGGVVCGLGSKKQFPWSRFLTLANVPTEDPIPIWRWVVVAVICFLVGSIVGAQTGLLAATISGESGWVAGLTIIGVVDCLVGAYLCRAAAREGLRRLRRRFSPLLAALAFGFAGAQFGMFAGFYGAIICVPANAFLGYLLGIAVLRRAARLEGVAAGYWR